MMMMAMMVMIAKYVLPSMILTNTNVHAFGNKNVEFKDSINKNKNLPGQGSKTQASSSVASPRHFSPSYIGAGLSHVLARVRVPFPQVTLQLLHGTHDDHPPSC